MIEIASGAPVSSGVPVPPWQERPVGLRISKRLLDLVVAVPVFVLSLPLQALIGLAIRLDSTGPAIFFQERLTIRGRRFRFCKFRTMFSDARTRFPALYDYGAIASAGGQVPLKRESDPRLTRIGQWLRRTSLDELPNLWNVIVGDMSLVGPRPEIPELLPCYSEEQKQIFNVKPGLTGLAQVSGRNRLTVAETIKADLEYARRVGIRLDVQILFSTVFTVLLGHDAY
jgi:lipopolysaccharide/colanic/teichoic acid biosynthesis glycosyltransferase